MTALTQKNILLGVTGGIAAYKSAELVRRLRDAGADVRVVMTRAAEEFITPLTMATLSDNPVQRDLFNADQAMAHIDLARWADAVLIAPATAGFMGRLANGLADDLLTTLCLATAAPIAVAPAMNQQMWQNQATQVNAQRLREQGIRLFGPAEGNQACGETGPGRMLEPMELIARLAGIFENAALAGTRVLITAGPTLETIDPVRFIGNRSSGKMGYALAAAAREAGASVVLVSGPVSLTPPAGVEAIRVRSALEMRDAVTSRATDTDIFIAAAAVADYRPETPNTQKIKKQVEHLTLSLVRNPDILAEMASRSDRPFCVGFAAETQRLEAHARAKLEAKGLDMIAANWVGESTQADGVGFDANENELLVLWPEGTKHLTRDRKTVVARQLIQLIAERYHERHSA